MIKVDSVSLLAIGLSICLHVSLLLLDSTKPSYTRVSDDQHEGGLFTVSLVRKAAGPEVQEQSYTSETKKEVDHVQRENAAKNEVSTGSVAAAAPMPREIYYLLSELEQPPQILKDIDQNPTGLSTYSQGGRVILQIWIDENGNVVNQELVETMLPSAFVDSAIKSFAQAKFIAGVKDGRPVRSTMKVVINYDPVTS